MHVIFSLQAPKFEVVPAIILMKQKLTSSEITPSWEEIFLHLILCNKKLAKFEKTNTNQLFRVSLQRKSHYRMYVSDIRKLAVILKQKKIMKKLIPLFAFFLISTIAYGQTEERFKVKGTAKLIATWTGKNPNGASGKLSSGDKVSIMRRQNGIGVSVIHNNVGKQLVKILENNLEVTIIKVYEYDFDKNGQKEIIVIHSPIFSFLTVEVFKYSGGRAERIGNFNGQFKIILDENNIYLPYGSQGLCNEYEFHSGAFFELIYHNPDNKDK